MTEEYNLKKSSEGHLKQLYPILLDAHGNIIDGFHRKQADGNWPALTLGHIDSTVKLELARLAANFCRRNVPAEELEQKIGFLIGAGLTVQEIAEQTGISERTLYRHMPEKLKKPAAKVISEAMIKKGIENRRELTPVSRLVECDCCRMGTRDPKPFGKYDRLCPSCYLKAVKYPRLFQREPTIKPKAKPLFKEAWEHRVAQMKQPVSKMDEAILLRLKADKDLVAAGWKIEFQKPFCLVTTTPDLCLTKGDMKIAVYLDGETAHKSRGDRDVELRDLLEKRKGVKPMGITYSQYSKGEEDRIFKKIKEVLL